MTFAGKPLDRCRIHTVPCPYGGQEAPCQRCNGDGESPDSDGAGSQSGALFATAMGHWPRYPRHGCCSGS